MKINIKGILDFYIKGFIIVFGIYTILMAIDMIGNEVFISEFWKGFIVAYSWWIYAEIYKRIQSKRRMERMISNMEELVRKFENGEITEDEVIDDMMNKDDK